MDQETIERFFVTFGVQYTGTPDGVPHPLGFTKDDYVVVEAPNYDIAKKIIHAVFADKYAFDYDEENFIHDGTRDRWYKDREPTLTIKWVRA